MGGGSALSSVHPAYITYYGAQYHRSFNDVQPSINQDDSADAAARLSLSQQPGSSQGPGRCLECVPSSQVTTLPLVTNTVDTVCSGTTI